MRARRLRVLQGESMSQHQQDWADALSLEIIQLIRNPDRAASQLNIPLLLRKMLMRIEILEDEVATLKKATQAKP